MVGAPRIHRKISLSAINRNVSNRNLNRHNHIFALVLRAGQLPQSSGQDVGGSPRQLSALSALSAHCFGPDLLPGAVKECLTAFGLDGNKRV